MQIALEEARKARDRDEVPVGAVLVHCKTGHIAARHGNRTREYADPTAHAEILVIRDVCRQEGTQRIPDYNLYVTLEPCTMCAAAISFARIRTLYFGADDEKGGGVKNGIQFFSQPTCHHHISVMNGLLAEESTELLKDFFVKRRRLK